MPGYVNGIPHATSTDRIDLWPTTSRDLAQWVDGNVPRNDDPRLSNARPPTTHTHERLDMGTTVFKLNPAGGFEHHANSARRWLVDSTGTLTEGTVPTARVHGLAAALAGKASTTDPRLSDARPPTAHTHDLEDVTGLADRLAVLEYRSGVRNVSGLLLNGWTGTISLCRVGNGCSLYFENLSDAAATSSIFFSLPSGFRPVKRPGDRVYRSIVFDGGLPPVLRRADIDEYGNVRIFTTVGAGETFSGSLEYLTVNPVPTTLPGTPA